MPAHDWTRVSAGVFHHVHTTWIAELARALNLNQGALPEDYYAQAEQVAGEIGPDVIALERVEPPGASGGPRGAPAGAIAVADAPPQDRTTGTADEAEVYARKRKTLVIRHQSGDRVVALLEIVSPGNEDRERSWRRFVDKACSALLSGIHLLVVDLHPPGRHDPAGVHGAIWAELSATPYEAPGERPLTLASYEAAAAPRCYVEPLAVGGRLPDMPLFLEEGWYVAAPLEATYEAAYRAVPRRWRDVLEAPGGGAA